MTLKIEPRLGVEVFVNEGSTISISNPDQLDEHGQITDVIVQIHPDYIDAVISALQDAKKEILEF